MHALIIYWFVFQIVINVIECYKFTKYHYYSFIAYTNLDNDDSKIFLSFEFSTYYVTGYAKTDLIITNTGNHLSVDESHTHALSKDTKHLRLDGQVCFYRRLFSDTVKPRGCISWPMWPLRGINTTAWGTKLILTADLASPVSCASLGHLLMAQHCHLCLSVCFSPPTAPTTVTYLLCNHN